MASTPEPAGPLLAVWLGRRDFAQTLRESLALREAIAAGTGPEVVLLVEHPPVLTLGRRGRREDVLWTDEQLERAGVSVAETPRGGEVTLHAPGQLVAYPIVRVGKRIREHIVRMADCAIEVLESMGISGAEFSMEHPGVWLQDRKLASIGIHVSRGVSVQGLSLNVDVDPGLFSSLVSCGLKGVEVISARSLASRPVPSLEHIARQWAEGFARRADRPLEWRSPEQVLG